MGNKVEFSLINEPTNAVHPSPLVMPSGKNPVGKSITSSLDEASLAMITHAAASSPPNGRTFTKMHVALISTRLRKTNPRQEDVIDEEVNNTHSDLAGEPYLTSFFGKFG